MSGIKGKTEKRESDREKGKNFLKVLVSLRSFLTPDWSLKNEQKELEKRGLEEDEKKSERWTGKDRGTGECPLCHRRMIDGLIKEQRRRQQKK